MCLFVERWDPLGLRVELVLLVILTLEVGVLRSPM